MLILKQNAANSVPTPPAGKGTIFLDDSDTLSVKTSDGNVETFPTVGAANAQVVYVNGTSLTGENAFTYDFNNNILSVSGNITAGNVLTNNLLYANGVPWDLSDPGGSNTQIQFNDDESFAGSAAFTFNKSTNVVAVTNVLLAGANASAGDFVNTSLVASKGDTGATDSSRQAVLGEALASSVDAIGVQGIGKTSGSLKGTGLQGLGTVSATGDSGAAVGVRGYANATHSGGYNIGVLGNASGSGLGNYAFYVQAGDIGSIETNVNWDLFDNSSGALSVNSTGKAGILSVSTVDGSEGVGMSGTLSVTGNLSSGNANLGNLAIANFFSGSGANLTNLPAGNISGQVANALVAGTVYTAAQPNITSVGTLSSLAVTGNTTTGNLSGANLVSANFLTGTLTTAAQPNITSVGTLSSLSVSGNVSAGNVSGTLLSGTLETAAQPNITSVGTLTGLGVNGNITAANITANTGIFTGNGAGLTNLAGGNVTGQVGNALVAGTVYTNAQPNITSVGTLSSLSVTGNVAAGNLTTTGVLSVTGTGVSSIAGNLDMTSNTIINLANPTNDQDAATKIYVDNIAQGLHVHAPCGAATPDTLANVTSGTITYNNGTSGVNANLVTTGSFNLIDGVNVQTSGTRILVKNEANAAHNGIYTWANSTTIVRAADFDTPTEMAGGDFTFVSAGTIYNDTGWVMTDPVTTVGTSAVNFVQFSGAGTYTAGTGLTLNGTVFSVNASQTQVTALGNVTSGIWNNNIGSSATFAAGLSGANLASITGANVTGQVGNALVAGTVYTAAQPNITSVGTLTGLNVNGTITGVNITANTGVFTGNGAALTNLNASNLASGTVPSARLTGSYSISVDSATTAGTVTTAAQPNITSVGTLTSLTTSGNINCGGFFDASVNAAVSAAGTVQGNATVIASEINVVSTVSSGTGVALPTAVAGVRVTIMNTAGNTLNVYPASGGAINSLATNAAYTLPAGGRLEFVAVSTTQWYTLNATYG